MPGFGGFMARLNPLNFLKKPEELTDAATRMGGAAVRPPEGGIGSVAPGALPEMKPPMGPVPMPLDPNAAPDLATLPRNAGAGPMMMPNALPRSTMPTPNMVQHMNRASFGGNTPIEQARNEYVANRPPAPGLKGRFLEAMKSAGTGFLQGAASNPENPVGGAVGGAIAGGIGGAARPDLAPEYRFNVFEKPRMEAEENRAMQIGMERAKVAHLAGQTAHDAGMLDLQRSQQEMMRDNLARDNERADWHTFEINDPETGLPYTVQQNVRTGERRIVGRSGKLINQQVISSGNNQTKRDVATVTNKTRKEIATAAEAGRNARAATAEAGRNARSATTNALKEKLQGRHGATGAGGQKTMTEAELQRKYGAQADKARQMLGIQGVKVVP